MKEQLNRDIRGYGNLNRVLYIKQIVQKLKRHTLTSFLIKLAIS